MLLQSCSSPQAVRNMKKHMLSRSAHKESSGYGAGRKASTRGSAGKDTGIIRCVMFSLRAMMWNGYAIETSEIMNGPKRTNMMFSFNGL